MMHRLAALFIAALALPAWAQVYRCGSTYTQAPCPGAKVIDTAPAASAGGEGDWVTIYFCKGYGGQNF